MNKSNVLFTLTAVATSHVIIRMVLGSLSLNHYLIESLVAVVLLPFILGFTVKYWDAPIPTLQKLYVGVLIISTIINIAPLVTFASIADITLNVALRFILPLALFLLGTKLASNVKLVDSVQS